VGVYATITLVMGIVGAVLAIALTAEAGADSPPTERQS
jgi:hypothetical protein